ncbi:hypothetical protein ES705_16711 [subsurface metagenome]
MIDDFWIKIFLLVYFIIIGLALFFDVRYYSKHFKGEKHGRKDNY